MRSAWPAGACGTACGLRASTARGAENPSAGPAEPLLDRAHLVVERLVGLVAPLVELEHRVDPRYALRERHRVQLPDHREDVLRRALERRPHRMHPVADAILRREPP